jgi:hypothetical protein
MAMIAINSIRVKALRAAGLKSDSRFAMGNIIMVQLQMPENQMIIAINYNL